jgi:hypothetical protein
MVQRLAWLPAEEECVEPKGVFLLYCRRGREECLVGRLRPPSSRFGVCGMGIGRMRYRAR